METKQPGLRPKQIRIRKDEREIIGDRFADACLLLYRDSTPRAPPTALGEAGALAIQVLDGFLGALGRSGSLLIVSQRKQLRAATWVTTLRGCSTLHICNW
jgi:hypothetical protein